MKVQLSLKTFYSQRRALVYNQDRSYHNEFDASNELVELVGGRPKSYWYAEIKYALLCSCSLVSEAPDQEEW